MAKTVLLIDDSITIKEATQLILNPTDVNLSWLSSYDAGRDTLENNSDQPPPNAILVDVNLSTEDPTQNGYALSKAIKAMPQYAKVPVILLNHHSDDVTPDQLADAMADATLAKPYDTTTFRNKLGQYLPEILAPQPPEPSTESTATDSNSSGTGEEPILELLDVVEENATPDTPENSRDSKEDTIKDIDPTPPTETASIHEADEPSDLFDEGADDTPATVTGEDSPAATKKPTSLIAQLFEEAFPEGAKNTPANDPAPPKKSISPDQLATLQSLIQALPPDEIEHIFYETMRDTLSKIVTKLRQ